MPTAVVTGANSGIGNALAKLLIADGYDLIACDISVSGPIQSLDAKEVVGLDVGKPDQIASLKNKLADQPVDIVFNVAGIASPPEEDALETINLGVLEKTFSTNTFGPLLLVQAVLPNLLHSPNPRIYNVSSRVGSIGDNSSGGSCAYRASKAALNSLSKSMAVDLNDKGVTVLILHPGIVKTNILPNIHSASDAVEPDVAAKGLWEVCKSKGIESSGTFWHRNGQELPW